MRELPGNGNPAAQEANMAGRHVALLRGINVGKAKRVAMADLRTLAEDLGFVEVATLLNSGNLVFRSPRTTAAAAARKLEAALKAATGIEARVLGLSAAELDEVVADCSLLQIATEHARLQAFVLADPAAGLAAAAPLARQDWGADRLVLGRRAAYVWCAGGILESKLAAALGKALGDGATARNWSTILKIAAMANAQAD
jgi:uncharacterized protein (DUF1697 family)